MDISKYKIGIIGLGPVGMIIAHYFRKAGCEVALCGRSGEQLELIEEDGIRLTGVMDESTNFTEIYSSVKELLKSDIDILISSVKAYQVDDILSKIEVFNKNTELMILAAQNGIGVAAKYSSLFNESNIFRLVINFAGNINAPNVVNVTFFIPPNYIASVDDTRKDVSDWLSEILTSQNMETHSVDSFQLTNEVWHKTILNASLSPLCAISKLTMKEVMSIPHSFEIIERLILEAVEVAKAEDIHFEKNFVKLCLRYLGKAGNHFPSLAVDLLNHKETEIEYMNGKLVDFGRKHYIRTPLNLTFTNMIRAITDKNLGREFRT
jgi:2-dehydropantoate 2-reductase